MLTNTVQEQPKDTGQVLTPSNMAISEPMSIDALPSVPAQLLLPFQVRPLSKPPLVF